tara:strand:+ start:35 stop:547 length:513 start_codon:yes stop_codon:yes gene_type:complete
MELKVFQRTVVKTFQYPFAEKLNPILHDIILEKADREDLGAVMMPWNSGLSIPEFKKISNWVMRIIQGEDLTWTKTWDLSLLDLWGQYYKKGNYQTTHTHEPCHWSFVYYVNTPKGCAPLVFTDTNKKIFPKSGMLVLFPGWLRHHVPYNKCKEIRSIISGNLVYYGRGQ